MAVTTGSLRRWYVMQQHSSGGTTGGATGGDGSSATASVAMLVGYLTESRSSFPDFPCFPPKKSHDFPFPLITPSPCGFQRLFSGCERHHHRLASSVNDVCTWFRTQTPIQSTTTRQASQPPRPPRRQPVSQPPSAPFYLAARPLVFETILNPARGCELCPPPSQLAHGLPLLPPPLQPAAPPPF